MRRKGLLGLVLLASAIAGFVGHHLYYQAHHIPDHTYITIADWGEDPRLAETPEVEVPLTGGESAEPFFSVMSPRDLVQLPAHTIEAVSPDEIAIALGDPLPEKNNNDVVDTDVAETPSSADTNMDVNVSPEGADVDVDVNALEDADADADAAEDIDVPLLGKQESSASASDSKSPRKSHNILLFISGFIVFGFFSYLTYQHFRR